MESVNVNYEQIATVFSSIGSMNVLDYAALAIVVCSILLSTWRGVVGELITIAGLALAVLVGQRWGNELGYRLFGDLIQDAVFVKLAGWVTIFLLTLIVISIVRMFVNRFLKLIGFRLTDRILGMVFGCVRGVLILLLLTFVIGFTSIPQEAAWWQNSVLAKPLEKAVMELRPYIPAQLADRLSYQETSAQLKDEL